MTPSVSHYGYKSDLPDARDHQYQANEKTIATLPSQIDLRIKLPTVNAQWPLQSCTSHAIAAAFHYELIKQNTSVFAPSRLFIYYNERFIEKSIEKDAGAHIRNGIKSIATNGVCPETMWPYDPKAFAQKPTDECYEIALKHKAVKYRRVSHDIVQIKSCLAEGFPVIVGFTAFSSFESEQVGKTGILNLPTTDEKELGGHAVLVVGYDDNDNRFIVRNSWGVEWGISGYFTMPYDYLSNKELSTDFWTLTLVTENS